MEEREELLINLYKKDTKKALDVFGKIITRDNTVNVGDVMLKGEEIEKKITIKNNKVINQDKQDEREDDDVNSGGGKCNNEDVDNNNNVNVNNNVNNKCKYNKDDVNMQVRKDNTYIPRIRINRIITNNEMKQKQQYNSDVNSQCILSACIEDYDGQIFSPMQHNCSESFFKSNSSNNDNNNDNNGSNNSDNEIASYSNNNNNSNIESNISNNNNKQVSGNNNRTEDVKVQHNNINYDKQLDKFFFVNRYIEYEYVDKEEKFYDDTDLLRNLFEKNIQRDINDEWFAKKQTSPFYDIFTKLMEINELESKYENNLKQEYIQNETYTNNDNTDNDNDETTPILSQNEINAIKDALHETQSIPCIEDTFNTFFMNKMKELLPPNTSSSSHNNEGDINNNNNNVNGKDMLHPTNKKITNSNNNLTNTTGLHKTLTRTKTKLNENATIKEINSKLNFNPKANEIAFNIELQGDIYQRSRLNITKSIKQKLFLKGPNVSLYKHPGHNSSKFIKDLSYFDIRDIKSKEDELLLEAEDHITSFLGTDSDDNDNDNLNIANNNEDSSDDSNSDSDTNNNNSSLLSNTNDFEVMKMIENNREITEPTTFHSDNIIQFNNKPFKYFFNQLSHYYKSLLTILNDNPSYNLLSFLSNPHISSLHLNMTDIIKQPYHIFEMFQWHNNLQYLSIKSSLTHLLYQTMQNNEHTFTTLTSLTLTRDNVISNYDSDLNELFKLKNSISIQHLHLIDVDCTSTICNACLTHIDTFYTFTNEELVLLSKDKLNDIRQHSIPFLNLSFKQTPIRIIGNRYSDEILDMKNVYKIFIYMLARVLKYRKGTVPQMFNMLDISENLIKNEMYFIKIITKVKIVRKINISNTKIENFGNLIDYKGLLDNIKLNPDINSPLEYEGDNLYTLYEKEFFNLNNNNTNNDNDNNNLWFDYSMGIFPILEELYLYDTDIKEDISESIINLFERLKFFRGFYYSAEFITKQHKHSYEMGNYDKYYINENTRLINNIVQCIKDRQSRYESFHIFEISN